jgi:hypothetical protein
MYLLLQGGQGDVQGGWPVTWPGRRGFLPGVRETRYLYRAVAAYRDAAYRDVPRVLYMCTFSLQVE